MATRIITRAEGGIVPVSHTTARVARPAQWLLVHHTGDSGWPIPGFSDAQHMARLQSYSSGVGKTWEYNYVITYPEGLIWEQGGEFQASHCLNANGWSYGVQINQANSHGPPGPKQVESFRWLVWQLKQTGQLAANAQIVPHYRLRATGCSATDLSESPGPRWASPTGEGSLGNVRPELLVPWTGVPSAPPGGLILTPEDKAYLDSKFLADMEDRRACWRAGEMNNIMRDRAREGAMSAFLDQPAYQTKFVQLVTQGVIAAGLNIDPAIVTKAIQDALAGIQVEVDNEAVAKAVLDNIVLVQRQEA